MANSAKNKLGVDLSEIKKHGEEKGNQDDIPKRDEKKKGSKKAKGMKINVLCDH
jgi:hypothetical protein